MPGEMNGKKQILQKIDEIGFVAYDALLYLDTHPCDEKAAFSYQNYIHMYQDLTDKYAQSCGPLNMNQINADNIGAWVEGPWPWEGGEK